ncbi:MAG: ComF family protein [Balneolaceae bacterium]
MKKLLQSYIDVAFPSTCACCGTSLKKTDRYICVWCRDTRFEPADNESALILPESVLFQYSMWQFDKGGYLQDLLHKLKYHFLKQVGQDLGRIMGSSFKNTSAYKNLLSEQPEPLIIPVPLHPSKKRKRGYNQARSLARGLSIATRWRVIPHGDVERVRKTKTQTGLNTRQRSQNLKGAFHIKNPESLSGYLPVIVDDVYTTGATTFELARVLFAESGMKAGIMTVAKA